MGKQNRFSKHHPKHRKDIGEQDFNGLGSSLVDMEQLGKALSGLFESKEDLEWALRESLMEGPPHRQVRNAMILSQMQQILSSLNVNKSKVVTDVMGTSPKEYGFKYPIGVPTKVLDYLKMDEESGGLNWIGEGPYHEVAFDLLIMNCLESIKTSLEER